MQYAKLIDLIEEAKLAGEDNTEEVKDQLANAFERWLEGKSLAYGGITEEEEHALRMAFEKGFGICFHHLSADRQDQA